MARVAETAPTCLSAPGMTKSGGNGGSSGGAACFEGSCSDRRFYGDFTDFTRFWIHRTVSSIL
jgi:hypothetical protein